MKIEFVISIIRLLHDMLKYGYRKNKREEELQSMISFFQEKDPVLSELYMREFKVYKFKQLTGVKLSERRIAGFIKFKENNNLSWKNAGRLEVFLNWTDEENPFPEITSWQKKVSIVILIIWLCLLGCGSGLIWYMAFFSAVATHLIPMVAGLYFGIILVVLSDRIYNVCVLPYMRAQTIIKKAARRT